MTAELFIQELRLAYLRFQTKRTANEQEIQQRLKKLSVR
jgi:hypothetical protein